MKKIIIALTALAGITFLSGCAYDYGYSYYPYHSYAFGYSSYYHPFYGRFDCVHNWNATFCG